MKCPYVNPNDYHKCKAWGIPTALDKMCVYHSNDPEIKARRDYANKNKGMNLKLSKGKVKDSRDVQQFLGEVFENIKSGTVRISANQMSGLAALSQAYIKAEEKSNTLSRLENLEKAFLQQKKSNEKK